MTADTITINDRDFSLLKGYATDRIDAIFKRIKHIRGLKTFKDRKISDFAIEDFGDYLRELHFLDAEYKRIIGIFSLETYPISLLTDGELEDIRLDILKWVLE